MQQSKYNLFTRLKDSENYLLMNPLYGTADILDPGLARVYQSDEALCYTPFVENGYIVHPEEETRVYRQKYLDFIDTRDKDEVQLFFVPHYACNFRCTYCYQDEYAPAPAKLPKEVIAAFFEYTEKTFAGRQKYITLFGGEPLLPGEEYRNTIRYFFEKAAQSGIDVAVVTNGFHLIEYLDILRLASIREVQVTLDGVGDVHNQRRPHNSGQPTFETIANGIDRLLEAQIPVNLRMVIDRDNIENLPEMARFAIHRGWVASPYFKTQLGRNYELHHCQAGNKRLFDRAGLYSELYRLVKQYPEVREFHQPLFSVSKFLFENGELPMPIFDACPGAKTEWAFDYTGQIYACTATVGKKGEELGRFYPTVALKDEAISLWQERDVLAIAECHNCNVQHICGGGCAAIAVNRYGHLHKPDCRPVEELMSMGVALYFGER